MKKSHLVIISFQLAIIAIIIVMLGHQTMMLREIREEVTKSQQEIDLTVRTHGVILDLPDPSFVLFEGDIWHENNLTYRDFKSFPTLSIETVDIPEGTSLEDLVAGRHGFIDPPESSSIFTLQDESYYRTEMIRDIPTIHFFVTDMNPSHTWYIVDPRDSARAYHFSSIGSDSYFAEWILETLRFE